MRDNLYDMLEKAINNFCKTGDNCYDLHSDIIVKLHIYGYGYDYNEYLMAYFDGDKSFEDGVPVWVFDDYNLSDNSNVILLGLYYFDDLRLPNNIYERLK